MMYIWHHEQHARRGLFVRNVHTTNNNNKGNDMSETTYTLQQVRAISDGIMSNEFKFVSAGYYSNCFQLYFRQGDFNTSLHITDTNEGLSYLLNGACGLFTAEIYGKWICVAVTRSYESDLEPIFTIYEDSGIDEGTLLCFISEISDFFTEAGLLDLLYAAKSLGSIHITGDPTFLIGG